MGFVSPVSAKVAGCGLFLVLFRLVVDFVSPVSAIVAGCGLC